MMAKNEEFEKAKKKPVSKMKPAFVLNQPY